MASISSLGAGSNLDLSDLLDKIISAEREPAQARLDLRQTRAEATISALGELKSTLSAFQEAMQDLKNASFFSRKTAVSGDKTLFTATAEGNVDLGSYQIEVLNLAKANKLASGNFTGPTETLGSGTLTISGGGSVFNVDVAAGDSLADIRDAINEAGGNNNVRASLLTVDDGNGGTASKLVLTAAETGADGQIEVTVADDDGNNTDGSGLSRLYYVKGDAASQLTEVNEALDARITIDGFTVSSSTNEFENAIEGVTITALKEGDDPLNPLTSSLTVSQDNTAVKTAIEKFVANYNAVATIFNALTNYDASSKTRGLLSGDASINAIESTLRRELTGVVSGAASDFNALAFLGISTNKDGSIALDDDKLSAAISNRAEDIGALFSGEGGVASRLDSALDTFLRAGGVFQTREESLRDQLSDIQDDRDTLALRLEKMEARYVAQFSSLDILVSQLNQTGDFLTQQLEATAQIINRKSK